jgi:streptomycin 6-kinase
VHIPKGFSETVERIHGEPGRRWLAALPALLSECRARWSLELDQPFENLSYNLVLPGRTPDGTEVVLKAGVPCPELLAEASALRLFTGAGAVRLLDHDAPRGVLLLERVIPGTPLHELQGDPQATRTAAALMRRLWRTPSTDHPFPSLTSWFRAFERLRDRFDGGSGPFPSGLVARAENTFAELSASSEGRVLLHGDLHHANILSSADDGWLAIDPKGVVGDPGYEAGPFLLNQLPLEASGRATTEILGQRLSIFADELEIRRERLARWAFCHAVLSAVWDFEDSAEWDGTLRLARQLERLG